MKFIKAIDINTVNPLTLQPGQWVFAGDRSVKGQFLGVKASGVIVVAWTTNMDKRKKLRKYAKA